MRVSLASSLVAVWASLVVASSAQAQSQIPDAQAIRQELAQLRAQFEALEARLEALEGTAAPRPQAAAPQPAAPVPPGAAGAGGPQGALPVYGNVNALSKIFNPDMAVMGNFLAAAGRNTVAPPPPFEMRETELSLQSIVDPYARADVFFAVGEEGIELEEGYVTFPTLPGGLLLKAGKLRAAFGKVNTMHTHVLPWTDRPLITQNLLGGGEGIADAGISVARLLSNPWIFLEATGEVYRGQSSLFQATQRDDLTYVGRLRAYQDLSESSNLDLGASFARGHNDASPSETTRLFGIDATFRFRPLRRAIYRRLSASTEIVWSRRSELGGLDAFGSYVAADYQFSRRWFAGARYDRAERALEPSLRDTSTSLLVTYWPSEFSQIRGQLRRTRYAEGETANELLIQMLFSIGAHGAHAF
jgi:hypothetical protein